MNYLTPIVNATNTWPTYTYWSAPMPQPKPSELAECVLHAVRDLQAAWTNVDTDELDDQVLDYREGYGAAVHEVLADLQRRIAAGVLDRLWPDTESTP